MELGKLPWYLNTVMDTLPWSDCISPWYIVNVTCLVLWTYITPTWDDWRSVMELLLLPMVPINVD